MEPGFEPRQLTPEPKHLALLHVEKAVSATGGGGAAAANNQLYIISLYFI